MNKIKMKIKKLFKSKSTKNVMRNNSSYSMRSLDSTRTNQSIVKKAINVNFFRLPLERIKNQSKDIKKYVEKNENSKQKYNTILIHKANINIEKEKTILSLRKELKYQKMLYKNLIVYKDNIQKNSIIYKKNYDNICI